MVAVPSAIPGTPNISKQPVFNGCFNWMIPNHYIKNGCFTKHPLKNGCLRYQVYVLCVLFKLPGLPSGAQGG